MDRTPETRRVSPLTLRILAVNVAALFVLVVGLLYTGQYERGLIASGMDALAAEGRLIARMLSEGGARETLEGNLLLAQDLSLQIVRELALGGETRLIVFGKTGEMLLDSHQFFGPGGAVEMVALDPPFRTWSFRRKAAWLADAALDAFPLRLRLPPQPETGFRTAQDYLGVIDALSGTASRRAWRDRDDRIVLSAVLPVQDLKNVIGAAVLWRTGKDIEAAVHRVQLAVLRAFLVALLVTVLLTVYLSETIVHPLKRLAAATRQVRTSLAMKDAVPDFSYRGDEIGDLSRAFREMTQSLSERMDAIGRFAADVAHEIKNPLASLKSAVETFSRVKEEDRRQKLLAVIRDDVDRLNRLITDISAASRLDSELSRAARVPLDLAGVLDAVVEAARARVDGAREIAFRAQAGQRLPVTGNETQLAQVVDNLVDNAISFTPRGGRVDITARVDRDRVVLCVENDGSPIPEDKLEAVFERFYSERPKSEKFGLHSGLGLSISRQIARMHGGEVTAENLKNADGAPRGVRFTVILPAGAGMK